MSATTCLYRSTAVLAASIQPSSRSAPSQSPGLEGDSAGVQQSVEPARVGGVCAKLRPPSAEHRAAMATLYGQSPGAGEKLVCPLGAGGDPSLERAATLPSPRYDGAVESYSNPQIG